MVWIWQHPEWPSFRWEDRALASPLAAARHAQGLLYGQAQALGVLDSPAQQVEPLVRDALGTAEIEGERPEPDSVRSSVLRRLNLPTAGLPAPPRSSDGLVEMLLDATQHFDAPLTEERLFAWQSALFPGGRSGLRRIVTGGYRGEGPMRVVSGRGDRERVHFEAPPSAALRSEVAAFLEWFASSDRRLDGLVRAGVAHLWFVTLHPLDDGNGRVARAITDLALAQADRLPVRLQSLSARILHVRDEYYTQLETTQRGGLDVTPWLVWFLAQVEAAAQDGAAQLGDIVWRRAFWERHRDADLNARQRKVLTRVLEGGPDGFAGGLTNRKYVALTRCSRATAQRDLERLVVFGCLTPTGDGRARRYELRDAGSWPV